MSACDARHAEPGYGGSNRRSKCTDLSRRGGQRGRRYRWISVLVAVQPARLVILPLAGSNSPVAPAHSRHCRNKFAASLPIGVARCKRGGRAAPDSAPRWSSRRPDRYSRHRRGPAAPLRLRRDTTGSPAESYCCSFCQAGLRRATAVLRRLRIARQCDLRRAGQRHRGVEHALLLNQRI